jgi:hypothetical protein
MANGMERVFANKGGAFQGAIEDYKKRARYQYHIFQFRIRIPFTKFKVLVKGIFLVGIECRKEVIKI